MQDLTKVSCVVAHFCQRSRVSLWDVVQHLTGCFWGICFNSRGSKYHFSLSRIFFCSSQFDFLFECSTSFITSFQSRWARSHPVELIQWVVLFWWVTVYFLKWSQQRNHSAISGKADKPCMSLHLDWFLPQSTHNEYKKQAGFFFNYLYTQNKNTFYKLKTLNRFFLFRCHLNIKLNRKHFLKC